MFMAGKSTRLLEGVSISTGSGELNIRKRLNQKWGKSGHCIRLSQHKGDPEAISDLILGINGDETYSIEVKRITNAYDRVKKRRPKTRALSFSSDFSVTTREIEYPHQLIRQTILCERMGWIPLIFLQVVTPSVKTEEYLFSSRDLCAMKLAGFKSLKSEDFKDFHDQELFDHLFLVDRVGSKTDETHNIDVMRHKAD